MDPHDTAGIINIRLPIGAVGDSAAAPVIGDDAVAKRLRKIAPGMKSAVIVDKMGIQAGMVHSLFTRRERTILYLGKKRR